MIIKVLHSISENRIYITSKPSHNRRDKEHSIEFVDKPSQPMLDKMQGKNPAYFHAHLKDNALVIDDLLEDQRW